MHTWRLQQQHCVRVRSLLSTIFTFHSQAWLPLETLADCDWRARCVCNIARTPHSPHTQIHTRLCCGLLLRRPGCCDDPSTVHRHRASTLHPALVGNYVYCLLYIFTHTRYFLHILQMLYYLYYSYTRIFTHNDTVCKYDIWLQIFRA